jgi:hypothetical protein
MGAGGVSALVVLLLASALLPDAASSRVREGESSSGKVKSLSQASMIRLPLLRINDKRISAHWLSGFLQGAPAPTVAAGGSSNTDSPKDSGQSSAAGQQAESTKQQDAPPPTTAAKDSKQLSTVEGEKKGQDGDGAKTQTTATSPPPPPPPSPVQEKDVQKEGPPPPPEGSGPNGGDEVKGGTDHKDTGKKRKDDATEKLKEVMEKCDASHKCSAGEEFFACLQVSDNGNTTNSIVVQ